jgi:hypothetical protein
MRGRCILQQLDGSGSALKSKQKTQIQTQIKQLSTEMHEMTRTSMGSGNADTASIADVGGETASKRPPKVELEV